jgi:hypothetical protein
MGFIFKHYQLVHNRSASSESSSQFQRQSLELFQCLRLLKWFSMFKINKANMNRILRTIQDEIVTINNPMNHIRLSEHSQELLCTLLDHSSDTKWPSSSSSSIPITRYSPSQCPKNAGTMTRSPGARYSLITELM